MPPLDMSSTYEFEDAETFARASADKVGSGYVYTRWANPTIDAFEAAVADLEDAQEAEAFATGMAAVATTFMAICKGGDRIVAARQLYGGSFSLLDHMLPRYGIETTFVDVNDLEGIAKALVDAQMLYCETIGNPRIVVADLPRLAALAYDAGVPLVVDNTFASPVLCRPLVHGASVVVHSATKFIGGHNDIMGGVVCGSDELLTPIRDLARELGPTLSPFNAWLGLRGLQTIHLRVERSSDNALALARWLADRDDINAVFYPALEGDISKSLCDNLLGGHGGGTLAFDVAGGIARASRFQDGLEVVKPAASLGGTRSLIVHAASVTHTQLDAEQLEAAGISAGFCRMSVGIEDVEDLRTDLEAALDRAG